MDSRAATFFAHSTDIVAGRISLSPYVSVSYLTAGDSLKGLYYVETQRNELVHEFTHACDFIKAQIKARDGDIDRQQARLAVYRLQASEAESPLYCKDSAFLRKYFRILWQESGESEDFARCLEQTAENTSHSEWLDHCKDACRGQYLVEAFAEGAQLTHFDRTHFPFAYPSLACRSPEDRLHPKMLDVMECLAQYSPDFRSRFKKTFSCQ